MNHIFNLIKVLLVSAIIVCFSLDITTQEQEKILETVEVKNIAVSVRVFFKGKTVPNLHKENFTLFVNGVKQPIHGFFDYTKKVQVKGEELPRKSQLDQVKPRLFLLIFNITDYHLDIKKGMDIFFGKVLRPNDRLMVISNNFFLSDRVVKDIKYEKQRIDKILEIESTKMQVLIFKNRINLKKLLSQARDRVLAGEVMGDPRNIASAFIISYRMYLKENKYNYLDWNLDNIVTLADYLKTQKAEKWAFNFYQLGGIYRPQFSSSLEKFLKRSYLYRDLLRDLGRADDLPENDLAKLFLDTGATFFTLLMRSVKHDPLITLDGEWELRYRPIATNLENPLRKISELTGGSVVNSNKFQKFYEKIYTVEDTYYVLTYDPSTVKNHNNSTKENITRITVDNIKCKVVYDDQKRPAYFKNAMAKKVENSNSFFGDSIKLQITEFIEDYLYFKVLNFKRVLLANGSIGYLQLQIKIVNDKDKVFLNKKENVVSKTKEYGRKVLIPKLKNGDYFVIIEATDLNTGKNDLVFHDFKIENKNITSSKR